MRALLNALADAADVNKRAEKMIFDHCRTIFGLHTVHVWDLFLPESGMPAPRFTIAQASQAVLGGTKLLGERYTAELTKLLDPTNGRLDIARVRIAWIGRASLPATSVFRPCFSRGPTAATWAMSSYSRTNLATLFRTC